MATADASATIVSAAPTIEHALSAPQVRRPYLHVGASALVTLVLVCALGAPWLSPQAPGYQDLRSRLQQPSSGHWLGTDQYGRDIVSRILWGSRLSLFVAVVSVGVATLLGTVMGVMAAYYRGVVDTVLMRVADTLLSLPALVFALGLMAMLGAGVVNVITAIAVAMTPNFARVVRSVAVSVCTMEYMAAAKGLGVGDGRILCRHLLPNCVSPIIVLASITVARAILIESNLSFLGVGVPPTAVTWGLMVNEAQQFLLNAPWVPLLPGVAIMVTVLAINVLGDGLRDRLDPRVRRS